MKKLDKKNEKVWDKSGDNIKQCDLIIQLSGPWNYYISHHFCPWPWSKMGWVATAPKLKARIPQTGAAMGGGVKERFPPPTSDLNFWSVGKIFEFWVIFAVLLLPNSPRLKILFFIVGFLSNNLYCLLY